jgi:nucleoside-diphosphate-sugar epimerase
MKTIAVFGASGLTAQECVYQALQNGDKVVGLTRYVISVEHDVRWICRPSTLIRKLTSVYSLFLPHRNAANVVIPKGSGGDDAGKPIKDAKLILIRGDVTKMSDVEKVFDNDIDGVVVALGGKTSDVGETMLRDGTANIIAAMKAKGVKRLAVVTSIGAGDSESQAPFFFKVLMWTAMKKIFEDKNAQEEIVSKSGLEYCIVRPGGLTVDPPTGVINVIKGEAGSIARADVAQFCLDAVTVEDFPYLGQAPCISSVGGTSWVKDRSAVARGAES